MLDINLDCTNYVIFNAFNNYFSTLCKKKMAEALPRLAVDQPNMISMDFARVKIRRMHAVASLSLELNNDLDEG